MLKEIIKKINLHKEPYLNSNNVDKQEIINKNINVIKNKIST